MEGYFDAIQYRVGGEEGQEDHRIDLAERFDRYVLHLKESFGEIGDQRHSEAVLSA